jgi:2-keto-4-pentenoate hydratase/2-oxohepta-3-ene-1,7-dioic acid hydratase in catechol pathway
VVTDGGIIDIAAVAAQLPRDMIGLIANGDSALDTLRRVSESTVRASIGDVRLLAPVPQPPEFLGVGLNYRDHIEEAGLAIPEIPTVFNKQTSAITGPYDDIVMPAVSDQLDYEGELGIVIGLAGRNLSERQAQAAIFGYVVVNDLSVRDWQFMSPTVTLGKSFDTHGPFGPWIVTADEVPDPQRLAVTTRINGEVRQAGHTADMIFSCAAIVAFLSRVMTLQPGTVITTGTPAGVGVCRKPQIFLHIGDLVSVDIEGVGRIANRVVSE